MYTAAFPLLAATITRDPVQVAGVTVAAQLPWMLVAIFAGALADRLSRRRLLVAAELVRCASVSLLAAALVTGPVSITVLYACAFALGAAETVHANASQAYLPVLVGL